MQPKVGQYYFAPRGRHFCIYRYTHVSENGSAASPVTSERPFTDKEDARRRVYELNGWRYTPATPNHRKQ